MANKTPCLTSGAIFHTGISEDNVSVKVDLPFKLEITSEEAEILETMIHNQMELILRSYFKMEIVSESR
ncbi:MAG TPA: hypothetical protein EYQ00_13280 [Dehalococcoidia bacterium]|nr:hypothetical protein [Dehalococcoidia bacterium]